MRGKGAPESFNGGGYKREGDMELVEGFIADNGLDERASEVVM